MYGLIVGGSTYSHPAMVTVGAAILCFILTVTAFSLMGTLCFYEVRESAREELRIHGHELPRWIIFSIDAFMVGYIAYLNHPMIALVVFAILIAELVLVLALSEND